MYKFLCKKRKKNLVNSEKTRIFAPENIKTHHYEALKVLSRLSYFRLDSLPVC